MTKPAIVGSCVLAGSLLAGAIGFYLLRPVNHKPRQLDGLKGNISRGAYLARASGCFACHSRPGKPVLSGGAPLKTPFGIFYAPNITTHKSDGIGSWTLNDFANAVLHGVSPDGKSYYPVFLYPNYTLMSDQDIVDMWAAFQTVPPKPGRRPPHALKFPFGTRLFLNAWKRLFFTPGTYKRDPTRTQSWNRGAFLANGPTHCVTCHSPKTPLGSLDFDHRMNGDAKGLNGERIPPITATALTKAGWRPRDLVFALKTGSKPDGDVLGSTMGEVVRESTRFLSNKDLEAIAEYLFSIEHRQGKSVVTAKHKRATPDPMRSGQNP